MSKYDTSGNTGEPAGRGAAWTEERATKERATREGGASRAPRWRVGNTAWRNWAGTESALPRRIATPRSADEVADEVRKAGADGLSVRMVGTGHSFTRVAVTDGVLLRPEGLRGIR